ncbi:hypothetical protein [Microbaculum marinum]|uniref:4Fe-4S ferredoxin-type domain-containing protein n=1 Tax=Microbaculum marinum TaxID=1764581 RepID=A0AAW9RVV5_9HYPH
MVSRPSWSDIAKAFARCGLVLRGGFHPADDEDIPDAGQGRSTRTILLVGNAGPDLWDHFGPHSDAGSDPLDRWTREVAEPIAAEFDARAVFPFDKPPLPFQRWAMRAEPVHSSPLGILIHPDHGLWHAYRAALMFAEAIDLPPADDRPSPCEACADRPCLTGCPVGAFSAAGYDVAACASYLKSPAGQVCLETGCQARNACPVASDRGYGPAQIRFHMAAFRRAVC